MGWSTSTRNLKLVELDLKLWGDGKIQFKGGIRKVWRVVLHALPTWLGIFDVRPIAA